MRISDWSSDVCSSDLFRRLNPNCKLPVLVDQAPYFADEPVTIFESGAMLLYLAEKSGQFLPAGGAQRWEVLKWLIWQVAGHGPMNGQAHHFLRYAPEGQDYGVRSEEHTSELQSLMRTSYAVFCLHTKNK